MAFTETWSLRKRLIVLVLAALLPVGLLAITGLLVLADQQREQTRQSMLATVRAVMTAIDSELEKSISALEALGTARSLAGGDLETFYEDARRVLAVQPAWTTVALFGSSGEYLLNLLEPYGNALPKRSGDPRSLERAVKDRRPVVGNVLIGQVTKEPVIPLRVPVMRDGAVLYVLTVAIKPHSLLRQVESNEILRGGGVVAVVDARGIVVTRTRGHADFVGKPASAALRSMMEKSAEGWGPGSTLDGEQTYTAYTRSELSEFTVAMGLPRDALMAPWRQSYAILSVGMLITLVTAVAIAILISSRITGPISALGFAARALGRGEQPVIPATGMPEVRDVGAALLAAATSRASAEAERENLLERERTARALAEAANRGKDEFLAMLGHELRNPLGAISNAALLIDDKRLTSAQRTSALAVIRRQSGHLKHLVDDLLDVGRVMTGKIFLERRSIDLAHNVREVVSGLAAAGRTSQHTVKVETVAAWVDADSTRMDQIITNLLVNAVTYTPVGGEIAVTVSLDADCAVLAVADTGQGISSEALPRLFDLFFQAPQAVDRPQSGLGIGLTLVERLVTLHGGTISAASAGPGMGATFTVRLPSVGVHAEEVPAQPLPPPSAALKILIVEDNQDSRESLQLLLELQGHHVVAAGDGNEGLAKVTQIRPEVALVDIGMPGLDGYGVARAIRADYVGKITLIALTGYGSEEDAASALAAGFDHHLTKPVDMQELAATLSRV